MLKYIYFIIILILVIFLIIKLREKMYNESFEGMKIDVKGVTELEKIVNATQSGKKTPMNLKLNNNLGEDQYLVQEPSYNISEDVHTFPDSCPVDLGCSDPPEQNEKAILDVYRNTLNREPDKLGFYYWVDRIKTKGDTIDVVTQAFKKSPEYRHVLAGYDKTVLDDINDLYNINNSPQSEGISNTMCKSSFGTFANKDMEDRFICSKENPICWGYSYENGLGNCGGNKGYIGSNVVVLGNYNMEPWKMDSGWLDIDAKWIWYTENADIEAGITGNVSFYYTYYNYDDEKKVDIYIAVQDHAEVYLNKSHLLTQSGGFPTPGIHRDFTLIKGENNFQIDVLNKGNYPKPAGLLLAVSGKNGDNNNEPILHTDESWTYQHAIPVRPRTYIDEKTDTQSKEFNPLIALWNKKHGGFLKMSLDTSIDPLNELGEVSLLKSLDKKLPNTYEMESAIFKYARVKLNFRDDRPVFSLYNCRNQRYLRNNEHNIVDTSHIVIDQNLSHNYVNERWIPIINEDKTVSIKTASRTTDSTRILSVNNDDLIVTKAMTEPDDDSKWEIVNIDTIHIGDASLLDKNKDNQPGFIKKITDYIGYVGNFPINTQYHDKPIWNESFMSHNITSYDGKKTVSIFRTDVIDSDLGWDQKLTLFGIHGNYVNKLQPSNFQLLSNGTAKRMIITNDKMVCFVTNETPYFRELNDLDTDSDSWYKLSNGDNITDITSGMINDKKYLFAVIEGIIKFRRLSKIYDVSIWETYNSHISGFKEIKYDYYSKMLYGLKDNKMYIVISRSEQLKLDINLNVKTFAVLKNNTNIGTYLLLVDNSGKLFISSVIKGKSENPMLLANNINIRRLDSINNIIFAIREDTGQLYYKPVLKDIPFIIYNKHLPGNLIDVHIYKDEIYVIDRKNQVLKCPIILN